MSITFTRVPSPVGELLVAASDRGITGVYFPIPNRVPKDGAGWVEDDGPGRASEWLTEARRQLTEYFAGSRTTFDLPPTA